MYKFDIEKIISKKINQFNNHGINIEQSEVKKYIDEALFRDEEFCMNKLENFIDEDNLEDIINFLMSDAIVNPKF